MIIQFDKSGTVDGLKGIVDSFSENTNIKSVLVLAGNNPEYVPEKIDYLLKGMNIPIIGGVFSYIIYQKEVYSTGSIVVGLPFEISTHIVSDLSNKNKDLDEAIEDIAMEINSDEAATVFVFNDYYSTEVGAFIDSLYSIFGVINNFIGGGAGLFDPKSEMMSTPCIITNKGILKDCAVLGFADTSSDICANHGWEKVSKPYRVTSTIDNRVNTIDWQPASELYMKIVSEDSGKTMTKENFFEIGNDYSLGFERMGSNIVAREPISINEDKSLTFIVSIPNESYIYVLKGSTDSMLEAVDKTTSTFYNETTIDSNKFVFVIDCVSRYFYMGDDFDKELSILDHKDAPTIGALTMGEIANTGHSFIEAYNKTFVIGVIDAE